MDYGDAIREVDKKKHKKQKQGRNGPEAMASRRDPKDRSKRNGEVIPGEGSHTTDSTPSRSSKDRCKDEQDPEGQEKVRGFGRIKNFASTTSSRNKKGDGEDKEMLELEVDESNKSDIENEETSFMKADQSEAN
ncbi:hypothetical protein ABEW05_007243 [Botrytis cinerea]